MARQIPGATLSHRELMSQDVLELPERQVLTVVDPNLTGGALSFLGSLPQAPVPAQPAPSSVPSGAPDSHNPTNINTFSPQSTLTTSNVNSSGATSGGMTTQYAPITQGA